MTARLCIAIHDVSPATWPRCERLLMMLDTLGAPPLTLLVVPNYHYSGRVDADRRFRCAIDARVARGDEVALHGYVHLDESAPSLAPLQWARRRLLTAGEGEFAALHEAAAAQRIESGLRMLDRCGWEPRGFVAPAWLLGAGSRAALARTRLRYTSTHAHLEVLNSGHRISAPALSTSARSRWRRVVSRAWLPLAGAATGHVELLRVALHPDDASHADLLFAWQTLLRPLLTSREAMTKSNALTCALKGHLPEPGMSPYNALRSSQIRDPLLRAANTGRS
jgi:predicted deacetylase